MKYHNEKYPDMHLFYSTPNIYIDALKQQDIQWPTKYDDLLPYADGNHSYWTGYFTSWPNLKGMIREAGAEFTNFNFNHAYTVINSPDDVQPTMDSFTHMFEQLGVMQHHDAVTGTAKQHVIDDYRMTLDRAKHHNRQQIIDGFDQLKVALNLTDL